MFGSRLAVVPGGALIVPSGSGGVGEWGGSELGGETDIRGPWWELNEGCGG